MILKSLIDGIPIDFRLEIVYLFIGSLAFVLIVFIVFFERVIPLNELSAFTVSIELIVKLVRLFVLSL